MLVRGDRSRRPGRRLGVAETRRQHTREQPVGSAEQMLIGNRDEVVERAVNGAQAARQLRIVDLVRTLAKQLATSCVILGDQNLVVDEPQVVCVDDESLPDRRSLGLHRGLRQERRGDAGEEHCGDHHERPPLPRAELSQ
jgi:hypothetical protein